MLDQALLREQFQQLLWKERQAEKAYAEMAEQIADGEIRQRLEQLCMEKQRHIQLVERLLEILE